ncbi:MAG: glycosyltransferase family 1 protein, partial [Chitinophagaceae bacterium]|nr:glycosyltransferase family 1 protein [Chitinophagaceae bacterium]
MDIICFSHLRWNFVYQRPQHLMTRFAKQFRIYFVEEPCFQASADRFEIKVQDKINIVTIHLKGEPHEPEIDKRQQNILHNLMMQSKINEYILWYYTPMALRISEELSPVATVFDCMDELSAFLYAPAQLKQLEKELLAKADVVFTGGHSLYAAKK